MATWRFVKSIVKALLWAVVQVLSKMMFLTQNVLVFVWMGSEAVRGTGLLAVV